MRMRIGLLRIVVLAVTVVVVAPALATSARAPGATFVAVSSSGISLYSSSTGQHLRTLSTFRGNAWTDNGVAYAADGGTVYFTLIPRRRARAFGLLLMRLDVATGHEELVARGAQPSLSGDGKQLAYGAASGGLAVRDLATGRTRYVALNQLGKAANLLDASIHWLGDGSDVAIVPAGTAWDLMGKPPKLSWCGTSQKHAVVVFVHVPPPPRRLTSTCIRLSGPAVDGAVALGSTRAAPNTLLLASDDGPEMSVEKVTETGAVAPVLQIPDSLPQAFDPSGTRLLYIAGHRPPRLTEATIANTHLIPGGWRTRKYLGAVAW